MKNGNPRLLPTSQKIKNIFDFFLIIKMRKKPALVGSYVLGDIKTLEAMDPSQTDAHSEIT